MAYVSRWLKRGSPSKVDSQGGDSQLSTLNEDFFVFDSQIEEEANNDDRAMVGLRSYISHLGGGSGVLDGWHATRGNFGRSRGSRGLSYISPDGHIYKNKAAVASVLKLGAFSQPAPVKPLKPGKPVKTKTLEHNVPSVKEADTNEEIQGDTACTSEKSILTPSHSRNLVVSDTTSSRIAVNVGAENDVAVEDSDSDDIIEGIACSSPTSYEAEPNISLQNQSTNSVLCTEREIDSCEVHRTLMSLDDDDDMDDEDDVCFAPCDSPSRDASLRESPSSGRYGEISHSLSSSSSSSSSSTSSSQDGFTSNMIPVTPSKVEKENCRGNNDISRKRRKSCEQSEPKNDGANLATASEVSNICTDSESHSLSYDRCGEEDDDNDNDDDDDAFKTCSSPSALESSARLPSETLINYSNSSLRSKQKKNLFASPNHNIFEENGSNCSQLSQTGKKSHARKKRPGESSRLAKRGCESDSTVGARPTRARRTVKADLSRTSEKGSSMTVTIETVHWLQDKVLPAIASVISMEAEFESILDAQPEIHARPKGRAPAEKVWEASLGTWVDVRWAYWHESVYKDASLHKDGSDSTTEEEKSKLQKAQERWTAKQNLEARLHAEIRALHKKLINPPMGKQPSQVTSMLQNVRSASLKQNLASLQEAASAVSDYCLAATIEFELEL